MELMNVNNNLTMTSKEIAELCSKTIGNVNRDIKNMLAELSTYNSEMNSVVKTVPYEQQSTFGVKTNYMYELNKELTLTLITGYSVVLRKKIIDRWSELEQQNSLVVFGHDTSTHRGALLALVTSLDKIEKDKSKVNYYEKLVDRKLLLNLRDTSKALKIKQKDFINFLTTKKYLYRDGKNSLKPYSKFTPSLFEIKEFITDSGYTRCQTLITVKGREHFINLLPKILTVNSENMI